MIRCDGKELSAEQRNQEKKAAPKRKLGEPLRPDMEPEGIGKNICMNVSCRLRKAGCRGFEGCPGFMSK
jgi:hypothetical protein